MIKAILFDLDGTLLDRDASVRLFVDNQYERFDKWLNHVPKDHYISRFMELDCRGYVWKDKVYQQLVEDFLIKHLTWESLLVDYITKFHTCCIPCSGLKEMLCKLRSGSLKLGLITNGRGQFQLDNINALGIEKYFDTILISEWEGLKKPNPEIFKKALRQLNIEPREGVYVGDHPINDVKAAKIAGLIGIWKRDFYWGHVNADFIIDHLNELPSIIDRLIICSS